MEGWAGGLGVQQGTATNTHGLLVYPSEEQCSRDCAHSGCVTPGAQHCSEKTWLTLQVPI